MSTPRDTNNANQAPRSASDDPDYATNLRRATLASSVGSALEYYDFALYGLASALIFSRIFFTDLDPAVGLVASFATFGVGFVARPLGGLFFGTIGDRIGRKWVLLTTIALMGGASTLVGVLPTYDQIGLWAPALLVFLRLLQGFGAGAEQAGATVLMAEYRNPARGRCIRVPRHTADRSSAVGCLAYPVPRVDPAHCGCGLHPDAPARKPHLHRA
jgi:MHS family metabolite:H+ symporter-like MFS transporter